MSAPAGWHLQPDGQERFWDGSQWTDHFRSPLPDDPTAPPPPPSWSDPVQETQAVDLDSTQAIPAPQVPSSDYPQTDYAPPAYQQPEYPQPGYAQTDYAQPAYQQPGYQQPEYPPVAGYPQPGYQQPGYPQTGYGAPGGQPYAPPPKQGGGAAKGCLIAAAIAVVVVIALIVGGLFVLNRAADTIGKSLPTSLPSGLPSNFPTELPTEGLNQPFGVSVGDSFDLPRASIQSGWSLKASGDSVVDIVGMKATLSSDGGFPVLFTMSFPAVGGDMVDTLCTASGSAGDTVDVSCVPLFGDVAGATSAKVTASL